MLNVVANVLLVELMSMTRKHQNPKLCTQTLAIVEDKLFFDLKEEGTTFRQQQGLDGKWEAVPWGSTQVDDSREWRWAHSDTVSIM